MRSLTHTPTHTATVSTNDWVLRQNSRQDIWLGVIKMSPRRQVYEGPCYPGPTQQAPQP